MDIRDPKITCIIGICRTKVGILLEKLILQRFDVSLRLSNSLWISIHEKTSVLLVNAGVKLVFYFLKNSYYKGLMFH